MSNEIIYISAAPPPRKLPTFVEVFWVVIIGGGLGTALGFVVAHMVAQ